MSQDNKIKELIINQLTKAQYKELIETDSLSKTELYIITDNANYTEEEILTLLETKQNKLTAGDGVTIENDIITINLDDFYTSNAIDELLLQKANVSETGYNLDYTDNILTIQNMNGDELSSVKIVSAPEVDNVTINLSNSNQLQSIGEITRNGIPKYTWIGTQEEYDQAKLNGVITELTEVLITDSEAETITPIAQYDAPTKLSELANDMDFVTQSDLQNVKEDLQNQIDAGVDDINLVHKTGTETIDGFKQFKQKIVIENTLGKGRIAHKPSDSSLEDGYIEFGDNTLLYGKQNIQGELYDEKKNIFHEGNLIAGNNITITEKDGIYKINGEAGGGGSGSIDNVDNETIVIQDDGSISAQGVLDQNKEELTALKFWSGTLEEYDALGEWDDNIIYNVTDDMNEPSGLPIASVDRLGGVKVDGDTINITQDGVISVTNLDNKLNKTQITNCLLEVPQRINLTLSDGTLTLKKGSVVTVPYGTTNRTSEFPVGSQFLNSNWKVVDTQFADNKFFVWAELQKDISRYRTDIDGKDRYISVYLDGTLNGATGSQSGTSFSNGLGYNTSENTVYWYNTSGVAQGTQLAFPIGIVACSDTYTFGSIKQVFNGMGYVGRTLWLDKGVKVLIGTGRNADGTINNTEITTKLLIKASHTYTEDRLLLYKKSGALEDILPQRYLIGLKKDMPTTISETSVHNYFCTDTLESYWTNGSTTANWQPVEYRTPIAVYGAIKEADGKTITFLNPYQAFRAVDYNEFANTPHITETYVNGTSGYNIWSNGYCEQWGQTALTTYNANSNNSVTINLLKPFVNTDYDVQLSIKNTIWLIAGWHYASTTSVIKAEVRNYNGSSSAGGSVIWRASGYIS